MKQKYYLCTRPRLAAELQEQGATVKKTVNPFASDPAHSVAWDVELTQKTAQTICDYFTRIGKPMPAGVAAFVGSTGEGGVANA